MLKTVQASITKCCCCCCNKLNKAVDDEEKFILDTGSGPDSLPFSLSTHVIPGHLPPTISSKDVPFAIPSRKQTPDGWELQNNNNFEDDNSSQEPGRSRTSTMDNLNTENLGELDVTMYVGYDSDDATTYPRNHLGRLWYSVSYDVEQEKLTVLVKKAKNLPRESREGAQFDCAVRVSLIPDEKRYLQSKTKRQQSDPTFNETFAFPLAAGLMSERSLYFILYQSECDKKLEIRGHAVIQLDETLLDQPTNDPALTKCWVDFVSRKTNQQTVRRYQKGKMLVSLKFDHLNAKPRLFVSVFKCIQMKCAQPTDVTLKIELLTNNRKDRKKKGQAIKLSSDEVDFNEIFKFSITEDILQISSISIVIQPARAAEKHKVCYGRVVLGGIMMAVGRELEHWQMMIDHPGTEHIQWHNMC